MLNSLNRWSGLMSLLALIIPMAAFLYRKSKPGMARWWAKTSIARTKSRIRVLNRRLEMRKSFDADYILLVQYLGKPFASGLGWLLFSVVFGMMFLAINEVEITSHMIRMVSDVVGALAKLPPSKEPLRSSSDNIYNALTIAGFAISFWFANNAFLTLSDRLRGLALFGISDEIAELEMRLAVDNSGAPLIDKAVSGS